MSKALVAIVIFYIAVTVRAQQHAIVPPKTVIENYLRMAESGLLLSDDGWREAGKLFIHPSPPADDRIVVVTERGNINESWTKGERAEEAVSGYDFLGRMDSTLKFVSAPKSSFYKTTILYHLVLVEGDLNGKDGKQWRIENPQGPRWVTVSGLVQYLAEKKKTTKDPILRRQAEETLSILKKYQAVSH